jgi:hypothetical protein
MSSKNQKPAMVGSVGGNQFTMHYAASQWRQDRQDFVG